MDKWGFMGKKLSKDDEVEVIIVAKRAGMEMPGSIRKSPFRVWIKQIRMRRRGGGGEGRATVRRMLKKKEGGEEEREGNMC